MANDFPNDDNNSLGTADPELEALLGDAYDAPPVPRSLLKRIDRTIEAEWGHAPSLSEDATDGWLRAMPWGTRWAGALPVAASLAVVVLLAIVLRSDSRAFGWASMIEALSEQGVVQVNSSRGTRWLSLAEGFVSERTAEASRMLDFRQGVVLERLAGAAQIRRRRFAAPSSLADRNQLVLGCLLSAPINGDDWRRFAGAEVVDENWKRIGTQDEKEIVLHVQLQTATDERLQLDITLDPASHLPRACEVPDSENVTTSLAFDYPSVAAADLRERSFPANLAIVDRNDRGEEVEKHLTIDPEPTEPPREPAAEEQTDLQVASTAPARPERGERPAERKPKSQQPPMSGAPAQWRAVEVVERSDTKVRQQIDSLLSDLWSENKIEPAPPADDAELLRRVYLDLAGRTPSVREVRAYLNDESPRRYELLVERLVNSPDHASHLATTWRRFLIPEGVDLSAFGGFGAFDQWLAERFAGNDSYDEVVHRLLLAEGRLSRSGPLLFYSAVKLDPDQLASRTARLFLGMRLECAQCHDHPFEPWTQEQFWSFAAFFAQISRPQAELESVSTVMRVHDVNRGEVMLPETDLVAAPRFLDGAKPQASGDEPAAVRRQQLARWLTSPENPYFARATVNRVWAQLFGKGIVEPVDDFGVLNPPKSPELLDLLASHFISTGFDLRELFRTVALSRAYRLSSGAVSVDEKRLEWFAQMNVKTLTAEQVYDCITVAAMLDAQPVDNPYAFNVVRFGNSEREIFLRQFRTPAGRRTEYLGGIPQALTLMNGTLIENATGLSSSGLLRSLEAPIFSNQQRIEVLYLATLSRRPRPSEWQLLENYIPEDAASKELQEGLADILWALLNSAEFTMNH